MNPTPNKLMPWLQAIAALIVLVCFFAIIFLLILRDKGLDPDVKDVVMPMIEVLKAMVLLLIGFLWGTTVNSGRKDEALAAIASAPPAPPAPPSGNVPTLGTVPTGTPGDPVSVTEVRP